MIRQIVLWLLRSLETSLDPDLQLRIRQYEEKVAAQEAEEKRLLAEIEFGNKKLHDLALEATNNSRKILELNNSIEHAKSEVERKKAELDRLSDSDAVRLDL